MIESETTYTLTCDTCKCVFKHRWGWQYASEYDVMEDAKENGWQIDEEHLCPDCKPEEEEE